MLTASAMIGFAMTTDAARSREFYESKLGFRFVTDDSFALVMKTDQNMIRIGKIKEFTPRS